MPYIPIIVLIVMIILNVVFRIASIFRLTIPLLYALVVPILFPQWVRENGTLVTVIWFGIVGLVILSWVVTIRNRIRQRRQQYDAERLDS